jgi:hypothetical protein
VFRNPRPATPPADYPPDTWPLWFSASAFYHNRAYGLLLLVGLILNILFK